MDVIQACTDTSDVLPLFCPNKLHLKPIARLNISVQIPTMKLPGKTISNTEVMDKLKYWAVPDEFTSLKVTKSTLEFIRFEAEIESRGKLTAVLARLDGRSIKISGFSESLKVRAAEAPPDFPTRHSWDSYFRDAKHMNEMKPGERPDTIRLSNLPCKWFTSRGDPSQPSEYIVRKVFEQYGEVRGVDIPLVDPYRRRMRSNISGISMFSHSESAVFDAYVQFKEYVAFVKAMDAFRGKKLVHMPEPGSAFSATIKVDFDKTKHMSDSTIKKRRIEREKLIAEDNEKEEEERRKAEKILAEKEAERQQKQKEKEDKLQRRREREKKRKLRQLEKMRTKEAQEMNAKIASEERLLIMAQRKLETIRLLGELIKKVEEDSKIKLQEASGKSSKPRPYKGTYTRTQDDVAMLKELELKQKLVKKLKIEREKKSRSKNVPGIAANALDTNLLNLATSSISSSASSLLSISDGDIEDHLAKDKVTKPRTANQLDAGEQIGPQVGMAPQFGMPPNQWYGPPFNGGRGGRGGGHFGFPFGRMMPPQMMVDRGGRGFFPRRRGFRWPRFPHRGRGGFFHPYMDPSYMDVNHQYYKYFQKLTHGRSSRSRSYSRSRSRSRSYSRSRSRSRRRWSSRSRSRSRSRRRSRSGSRSRSRSRSSRTRSRSKSSRNHYSRSKSPRKHSRSRSRSKSLRNHTKSRSKSPRNRSKSGSKSPRNRSKSGSKSPRNRTKHRSKSPRNRTKSRSKSPRNRIKSGSKSPRNRSKSRSKSPRNCTKIRSKSTRNRTKSRSKSPRNHTKSRSKSPRNRSKSRSKSPRKRTKIRSKSPRNRSKSGSKSPRNRTKSRSKSPRNRSRSRSKSKSPHKRGSWSRSSSRSRRGNSRAWSSRSKSPQQPANRKPSPKLNIVAGRSRSRSWDGSRRLQACPRVASVADSTTDAQTLNDKQTIQTSVPSDKKTHNQKKSKDRDKKKKRKKDKKDKTKSMHVDKSTSEEVDSNCKKTTKVAAIALKRPKFNLGQEKEEENSSKGGEKKRRISPIRFPIESKVVKSKSPSRRDREDSGNIAERLGNVAERRGGNVAERRGDRGDSGNVAERLGNVAERRGNLAERRGNVAERRDNMERRPVPVDHMQFQPLHRNSDKTDNIRLGSRHRRRR